VGVAFDDVDVLHGDTDVAAWGLDTYGSRSAVVGGSAVLAAAQKVVDKARMIAAHLLEASPDNLEFAGGRFSVRGDPEGTRTIADVAFAAFATLAADGTSPASAVGERVRGSRAGVRGMEDPRRGADRAVHAGSPRPGAC
jgi:carbon-monoxide dehydrogenase large subunit